MNRLADKDFSFKCPMSWDDMEATTNGKFCSKCRKEVFDLTNCSVDEVRDLQNKHGSICGSIRVAQAAVVALSLSAAACQKMERTTGTPLPIPPPSNNTKSSANTRDKKDQITTQTTTDAPKKVDFPKQIPIQEADPFNPDNNAPRLLGRICLPPNQNENANPSDIRIDI